MKSLCFLIACFSTLPLSAATYFVAVDGKDTNVGTIDAPFATVQRAQQSVAPGDVVNVRGGIYKMNLTQIAMNRRGRVFITNLTKSGTQEKPITYQAYEAEQPVFDCTDIKPKARVTAFQVDGSWLHLKGLAVVGVQVTILGHTQSICFDNEGSHNRYEQLQMHDGQAIGFWLGNGAHNLVLNCDAYRNHDYTSEDKRGGNVDGFGFHVPPGSVGNVFRGCRAWFNSDDGFDFISTSEAVTVDQCWAFFNGFSAKFERLADGNGFKAGGYGIYNTMYIPPIVPRHVIQRCLAVRNKSSGFYANHQPGGNDWLNNTAWNNVNNFNMMNRNQAHTADVLGYGHRLRNNLGFQGHEEVVNLDAELSDVSGNYWDLPVTVTAQDFVNLDESQLTLPRQSNGDLPNITLLHLAASSDLIGCGTDVGLPMLGKNADLGCFDFSAAK